MPLISASYVKFSLISLSLENFSFPLNFYNSGNKFLSGQDILYSKFLASESHLSIALCGGGGSGEADTANKEVVKTRDTWKHGKRPHYNVFRVMKWGRGVGRGWAGGRG